MNNQYVIKSYTLERILVQDANRIGKKIPFIHIVLDVDVTEIRKKIKDLRRTKKVNLSLTTYLLYCYVSAINEQKDIHGCKNWNNKVFVFDDVDVCFPIELKQRNFKPQIFRSVNLKNPFELDQEVANIRNQEKINFDLKQKFFLRLPIFIKDVFYKYLMNNPVARKQFFGTAYFSAGGMFFKGMQWGIPIPLNSVGMYVGNVEQKAIEVQGEVKFGEFLSFTISVDHSITDGANLLRFGGRVKQNIDTLIDQL